MKYRVNPTALLGASLSNDYAQDFLDSLTALDIVKKTEELEKKRPYFLYNLISTNIKMEEDQNKLERFLNNLEGEAVSIIPNFPKTTFLQIYGVTRKIDFLFIIEKIG